MFFSLGSERLDYLPTPLAVHCEWAGEKVPIYTHMFFAICASRADVASILQTGRLKYPKEFEALAETLPETADTKRLELHSTLGMSIGARIVKMANAGAIVELAPPELTGFWEPQSSGPKGEGLLTWVDPQKDSHLLVCRSKTHAAAALRSFDWMDSSRREALLSAVSGWNARMNSKTPEQRVSGVIADLCCRAAFYGKVRDTTRRSAH